MRRVLMSGATTLDGALIWEGFINRLYGIANWVTRNVQGTTLLQQARGILIAAVVAMLVALMAVRWPDDFPINWSAEPNVPDAILATLAIFAAVITVIAPTRLGAITSLGVVGIAITLFFVFHSAPDLAITQLLVDILTVVLLILVFYRIPPNSYIKTPKKTGFRNLIVAMFLGFLGFFFVLFTVSQPFFPIVGDYFLYNSVPLGHGGNVVNVILVDFRAFDTYGEIAVLGIAAVGGYAVLRAGLFRFRPPAPIPENYDQNTQPSVPGD
jgi:multicomponent Na+:H+ antiporter subunit A